MKQKVDFVKHELLTQLIVRYLNGIGGFYDKGEKVKPQRHGAHGQYSRSRRHNHAVDIIINLSTSYQKFVLLKENFTRSNRSRIKTFK